MTLHPVGESAKLLQRAVNLLTLMDVSRQWPKSREELAGCLHHIKRALATLDEYNASLPYRDFPQGQDW